MNARWIKRKWPLSLALAALLSAATASGQTVQSIQTLDRVNVYNTTKVLEMEFDDPGRTFDFTALGITPASSTGFVACQVTANRALYCIDGTDVRYWASPSEVAPPNTAGTLLFSCADGGLGLNTTAARPCTGLTVDLSGALWLAGRKGSTYSLFKLVGNSSTTCNSGSPVADAKYCATEHASGRQFLSDLTSVDGDAGVAFSGPNGVKGPGVLALEGLADINQTVAKNRTVLFIPTTPTTSLPVVVQTVASGDPQWGLAFGELLQSATVLQFAVGTATQNFVLATTNRGRILAVDALGTTSTAFQVFNIVAERIPNTAQCDYSPPLYGLRASSKSGRVYLTDRNYCQALALEIVLAGVPFQLRNVQETKNNITRDLTFSTTTAYPPDAATIAPGTVVNLYTCDPECTLLSAPDGSPAAKLSGVNVVSEKAGMSLFQVKDIPDCRWTPSACADKTQVVFDKNGVVVPVLVNGAPNPLLGVGHASQANQYFLNVTPLLPLDITAQFKPNVAPPAGLPRMLISPQYRAQAQQGFKFEGLFGRTEEGVVFSGTFLGEFDVGKLAGQKLGCGDESGALKPDRAWDVITTVSERVVTAGGPGEVVTYNPKSGAVTTVVPTSYVDTLTNVDCINPTRVSGARWSMYAYNLEIAPETDAVFAKLLIKLYDDLEQTRARLACGSPAVLSKSVCGSLLQAWKAGKGFLDKCFTATTQPKNSKGSENCNSFLSQVNKYQATLNGATTTSFDAANRLGELKQRVFVIKHVHTERFLPSIPDKGFTLQPVQ